MSDRPAPDPSRTRLLADGLRFRYDARGFGLHLPRLALCASETLLLAGPSGSGKTTLLRLLSGLLQPQAGELRYDDASSLPSQPAAQRAWRLRHAGLVFQDFALLDYLTAEENTLVPARFLGLKNDAFEQVRQRARDLADRLDLAPHWNRRVTGLSQGERQRVAIIRALALAPAFLFADEPTAALDPHRRDLVLTLLEEHLRETGAVLVLVTHDPDLAARFPRRLDLEDLRA